MGKFFSLFGWGTVGVLMLACVVFQMVFSGSGGVGLAFVVLLCLFALLFSCIGFLIR